MKVFFRKAHRWLGLLMALQIIAWMASGMYFAIFPIETIRGEHLTVEPAQLEAHHLEGLIPVSQAWAEVHDQQGQAGQLVAASLRVDKDKVWYKFSGTLDGASFNRFVGAQNGGVRPFMGAGEVRAIAQANLAVSATVKSVELVREATPSAEYRGRQLPVWRVSYSEPENLNLYIDGWTGEIVARRTSRWRIFDFLWMLHIMDFDARDDFNTPLLQIAAALGLLLALSGVIFWAMTTRVFRTSRPRAG